MKNPYKNITVKEYQRIYPALKEAKKEYIESAGYYDQVQFASVMLNKPYEDVIDLPVKKLESYQYLVYNSLVDSIEENKQVRLFNRKINYN